MPSRRLHDILTHLMDTSDVIAFEPQPIHINGSNTFYQMYMQRPHELLTLRRTIRFEELDDLPMNVYDEFIGLLEGWQRSGQSIDVNRRYKGVYLTRIERMMNANSFAMDYRVEFKVEEPDFDAVEQQRTRMMSGSRRSAQISNFNEDGISIWGQKTLKKKQEKHFEDELFKL